MRFTKPAIEALKKRGERYEVFEDGRTGLGIRISARGRKTWVLLYRFEGRARRMTLGTYPTLSLAQAHTRAGQAKQALERGNDPGTANVEQRRAERQAETVGQLIDEYMLRHAVKKRSGRQDKRILNVEVRPAWGTRKANSIRRRDVVLLLDAIHDRPAPVMRNRTASLLSKLFKFAVDRDIIETSPAMRLPRLSEKVRERVLSAAEVRSLWFGLPDADMAPVTKLGIKFLLVTGQRRNEVAGAFRPEIDDATKLWIIPPARLKKHREDRPAAPHAVPLSPLALSVLAEIDALRDAEADRHGSAKGAKTAKSPFLLPSPLSGDRPITAGGITHALVNCREAMDLGGDDAPTIHDLRRTCASTMTSLGISQFIVGKVLGHTEPGTTARHYDWHAYLDEKRRALDAWAAWIERVVSGQEITNIVRLPASA